MYYLFLNGAFTCEHTGTNLQFAALLEASFATRYEGRDEWIHFVWCWTYLDVDWKVQVELYHPLGEIMKCLQRQYIFHYLNTHECSKISEQTNKKQMLKTICRPSALCSSSVINEEWGKGCALFLGFLKWLILTCWRLNLYFTLHWIISL